MLLAPTRSLQHALRILATAATVTALATPGVAQQPAAWATKAIPGGVDPTRIDGRGKLTTYDAGTELHVFSAVHRRWQSLPKSPGAPLRIMNDCLLVMDGTTWTAFSSYAGRFEPLNVGASAQLVNPGSQKNDSILLVDDGAAAHAFSCFTGTWTTRALPPTTGLSVERHVALLADGANVSAFDGFTGTFHDHTLPQPATALDCGGTAGLALAAGTVHAFSAHHRTWTSHARPSGALLARGDDWALFYDSNQMVGYSALEGRFATFPVGATNVLLQRDLFGIVDTTVGPIAFSAARTAFTPGVGPSTATIRGGNATAILSDAGQVTAYSAVTATAATLAAASTAEGVGDCIAFAVDTATRSPWCFSGLTGTWHQAPVDTVPGPPQATATSILLAATNGAYAFTARSATFVPLARPGLALIGNDQSSVAAAWDATQLHAFDARAGLWRSTPRTGTTAPLVQIWRTAMFLLDGSTLHGFGSQDGTWSALPLTQNYQFGRANSESSRVATANALHAHAAVPMTMAHAQFPEFRRPQPTGTSARFSVALPGGGVAVFAGGIFAGSTTTIPGLGALHLQNPLATVLGTATAPTERATFEFLVPNDPTLTGTQLGFQSLALPTQGPTYLTDATGLYVP